MNNNFFILFVVFCCYLNSCVTKEENPIPKPKSYLRIDFPEKKYINYSDSCSFSFDIPVYTQIGKIPGSPTCHKVIVFPEHKADLILKYNTIDTTFSLVTEKIKNDAYYHSFKANAIDVNEFTNLSSNVYGITYEITGNSACNYMFYVSDSINHMLTGELLINETPNYDKLKPVIDFIKSDIVHLIETFEWKE